MLKNNLRTVPNREGLRNDIPRPNEYARRSIEDTKNIPGCQGITEKSNAASTERKERTRSPLNDIQESLLAFIAIDKLFCNLTLIGVIVMAAICVKSMDAEDDWMNCLEHIERITKFTKEQVVLAAFVTEFLLLICIYSLIVLNQYWNAVLHKQLGFLQWQRIWGIFILLVKVALMLECYTLFDYDAKIIGLSAIPLWYHYIGLIQLSKYISEIKIANERVDVISLCN